MPNPGNNLSISTEDSAVPAVQFPECASGEIEGFQYPGTDSHERVIWNCLANCRKTATGFKDKVKSYTHR